MLQSFPGIKNIILWDKKENKTKHLLQLILKIRKNNYDEVINLQRFFSTGLATVLSSAKSTTGFNKNPFSFLFTRKVKHIIGDGLHETERNLQLIAHLNGERKLRPILYPSVADFEKTQHYKTQPYVCIAPTSVWFTKQFPKEQWIKLIQQISKKNESSLKIYLLGGKDDASACQEIIQQSPDAWIENLAGKLSFLQTASLMKDAIMNHVNDSAPLHIASSMNAPVTAYFCSTVPEFGFGPLSDVSIIKQTTEKLTCRPCGLHGYKSCPEKHFKCASTILIE